MKNKKLRNRIGIFVLCLCCIMSVGAFEINVKGRVMQADNHEAIELANIVLQTMDSTYITGTASDMNGRFALNKINSGDYRLVISSVGYETQYIELKGNSKNLNLEDILMKESSVELGDVTVTAAASTSRSDRKIIFPTERIIKSSTNGVDVLQNMMLPKITVNQMNNEIKIPGNGEVQLRINGVKVDINDIKAIQPEDIIRIEFHDNPGLRYGNAEVVLDYIVRRPETGGSLGIDSKQGINAMWGEHNVNAKINHKKSEFSAWYRIGPRDFYEMKRNYQETFNFADGTTLNRIEKGENDHGELYMQNAKASYSFQDDNQMFNASFRYWNDNVIHWDYHGIQYNSNDPLDQVSVIDKNPQPSQRPSLDLYYQRNLKNDQTLVFNVVGTFNKSNSTRIYQESRDGEMLTDINNKINGKKYSIIGEGIYEKKFGENRLGFGLKHEQSFSNNEYLSETNYTTRMKQSDSYAYSEWSGKLKKLDYTLGVGVSRYWFHQENAGDAYEYYHFRPKITLQYNLPQNSYIRLKSEIRTNSPSLSNLSNVEQIIDSLQIQRGNPNLKPYQNYNIELSYEKRIGIVNGELWGTYEYAPKAIMDEKFWEGDKIVQTWDNQKNWQRLAGSLQLRVGPIKDIFQISFTGGVNHYISNGNDYSHKYTNWWCNVQASANYKNWTLSYMAFTNWNWFWGETMSGGENIQGIDLRYKYKSLSVGIGAFNPFTDNYKQETENWNKYASYKKSNYIGESSQLFTVGFTYNFSFGRSYSAGQKRLNNSDTDSGVMKSGK